MSANFALSMKLFMRGTLSRSQPVIAPPGCGFQPYRRRGGVNLVWCQNGGVHGEPGEFASIGADTLLNLLVDNARRSDLHLEDMKPMSGATLIPNKRRRQGWSPRRRTAAANRAVLNGEKKEKKVFRYTVFPKKPVGTPCVQPWLVVVGGWRLVAIGGW